MITETDSRLLETLEDLRYMTVKYTVGTYYSSYQMALRRFRVLTKAKVVDWSLSGKSQERIYRLPKTRPPVYTDHILASLQLWNNLRPDIFKTEHHLTDYLRPDAYFMINDDTYFYEYHNHRPASDFITKVSLYEEYFATSELQSCKILVEAPKVKAEKIRSIINEVKTLDEVRWIVSDTKITSNDIMPKPSISTRIRW